MNEYLFFFFLNEEKTKNSVWHAFDNNIVVRKSIDSTLDG